MSNNEYKQDRGVWAVGLTKREISMLLFWASKGIASSMGGTYEEVIPSFLKSLAKEVGFKLPFRPEFNSRIKDYHRKKKKALKALQKINTPADE